MQTRRQLQGARYFKTKDDHHVVHDYYITTFPRRRLWWPPSICYFLKPAWTYRAVRIQRGSACDHLVLEEQPPGKRMLTAQLLQQLMCKAQVQVHAGLIEALQSGQ